MILSQIFFFETVPSSIFIYNFFSDIAIVPMQESYHLFPTATAPSVLPNASGAPSIGSNFLENNGNGGSILPPQYSRYNSITTVGTTAASPSVSTTSATPPPPPNTSVSTTPANASHSPQPPSTNSHETSSASSNWSDNLSEYSSRFASYNGMAAAAAARETAANYYSSAAAGAAAAAANTFSPYAAAYAQNMMSWNSYSLATYQGLQREGVTYGKKSNTFQIPMNALYRSRQ